MLWFKQVEFNYSKKELWEQSFSWIIKFSHCLNFEYHKYRIIFFSLNSKWLYMLHAQRKFVKWTSFDFFKKS